MLIGAVISLVQLLRRASRPHVAILGRIPGTRRYSDLTRHDDNETRAGPADLPAGERVCSTSTSTMCGTR